jgi:uncharacterized protein YkwD
MASCRIVACCWLMVAIAATLPAPAHALSPAERMALTINKARDRRGLPPLRESHRLCGSAGRYAGWMMRTGYFGHVTRIRASRRFWWVGEALAWHSGWRPRVSQTVRAWLRSPPHRALLLSRGFRYLGPGMTLGRFGGQRATMWVLHFGRLGPVRRPRGRAAVPLPRVADLFHTPAASP